MFEYNDERHEYKFDGVILPSVTQVLPKFDFHCSAAVLEAARVEGIDNHSKIKMYLDTGENFDDAYIVAFQKFILDNTDTLGKLKSYEQNLYSVKHKFAGCPDIVFENAIIDVKRNIYDARQHALQLAGYSILCSENQIAKNKIWLIAYHDGIDFKFKNVYNEYAETIFLELVRKWYIDKNVETYFNNF